MSTKRMMWLCAAMFLLATVLNVRDLWGDMSLRVGLNTASSMFMMLFAATEAIRGKDDVLVQRVAILFAVLAALAVLGSLLTRWL